MSDSEDAEIIPLSKKALRDAIHPEVEDDSRAVAEWFDGGPEPAFEEIGARLLELYATLEKRGWHKPSEVTRRAIDDVKYRTESRNDASELKAAVARLVAITRNILRDPPPRPGGAGGPLAGQMALGKREH